MEACIGLGLIVSRLAHPAFSNRILTFHSNPSWVAIDPAQGWCQNVMELAKAPWGNNTDFEKTVVLLMERLEAVQPPLQPAEVPGLLVFSDMQVSDARALLPSFSSRANRMPIESNQRRTEWTLM